MSSATPRVGVGVFVLKDGRFLLGLRHGSHGAGAWSVPGGHLEFAESFESAAKREVREEANVEIGPTRVVAITNDVFESDAKHYVTIWVAAEYESGEPRVCEPDKFTDLGWYDLHSLPSPLFQPWNELVRDGSLGALHSSLQGDGPILAD